ncbi:MAG TPA: ABC transporter ATP-binding protein [Candidatus Cottocaccamicrobium excrementipullorum]|nr:ABC transporter ATP-binding protein [Candidatus Cottocaccamicrobium excrementipullorum]
MKPGDKLEKPKDRKGSLVRLGRYLFRYRLSFFCAFVMNLGGNLLALAGPYLAGKAVDAIHPGAVDFQQVFFYAGWMAVCYVCSAVLSLALQFLMLSISRRVVYQMRRDVFNHLLTLPAGYFDTRQTGDILSRISYDIDTINTSLSSDVIQLMTTAVTVVGSFVMMILVSKELVLVFCITVPLSLCITRFIVGKTRPLFKRRSRAMGALNGYGEEQVTGQKTLKAYHQEENRQQMFDQVNHEAVDAYYRSEYYSSITGPLVNFVNNLSLTLISVLGAVLFLFGRMSAGRISSFVLYSRKFSGPINEAANILSELQSALAAAERVFAVLDEAPEKADKPGALELKNTKGEVELSHVAFGYEPGKLIFKDLSLHAKPGSLVAIVGPTGAGKTTLINLLMRFYDANSGKVIVDGRPVEDWTRESLRKAYAMVLQDTWLFTGTVYENLSYGREGVSREQVEAAARAAGIHSFISRLPQGYDTVLNEEGSNVSKGQKQLLTIARAMLLDAGMLILDEATSNVDTRTERRIQAAMTKLMEGKTCFVIAHRLSTIRNADWILVMNHGEVIEQGTHDSLMAKGSFYRRLYEAQFQ